MVKETFAMFFTVISYSLVLVFLVHKKLALPKSAKEMFSQTKGTIPKTPVWQWGLRKIGARPLPLYLCMEEGGDDQMAGVGEGISRNQLVIMLLSLPFKPSQAFRSFMIAMRLHMAMADTCRRCWGCPGVSG